MFAHFRPLFIVFLSLALGIWCAELFRTGQIIFAVIILAICLLFVLFSFFKFISKKKIFNYLWTNKKVAIVSMLFLAVGFGSFFMLFSNVSSEQNISVSSSTEYLVIGEVRNAPVKYEDYMTMFLDDAVLQSDDDVLSLEGKGMYVRIDTTNISENSVLFEAKAGDVLIFNATVRNANVFSENDMFSYAYKSDFRYMAYTSKDDISLIEGTQSATDSVRQHIKDIIYSSMDERYAGLAYALFIGDVSGLDYDIKSNFQISGIAHLLAVSGLNTALMSMVLVWFFKKIRLKPWMSVVLVALLLLFYCVLCDFAPSVLRASLMSIFLLAGQVFGKQTDNISSVSLAGIILLLVDPMYLFDLSFQLSFVSVFAIFMLSPIFEKFFLKLRLGKFISSNLALSLAAQLGTLPLIVNTFGYVSLVSLVVNLIVVPFMSYVYILLFVGLMLTLILPFMWFLLWIDQWGLWLVDVVSSWFAGLNYASVDVTGIITPIIVIFFVFMFSLSSFCLLKRKHKIILSSTLASVLVLLLILNYAVPLM